MRTDRFKEHLTTEHPLKWSAYQELDDEGKKSFFTQPVLNTFLQKSDSNSFIVKNEVVELIAQLLCNDIQKGNQWWIPTIVPFPQ